MIYYRKRFSNISNNVYSTTTGNTCAVLL